MTGLPAVDLRSDTVTRPSPAMRRAMAAAEVGDDVFGEDPTVRRLEERGAELTGQEAALFVPSGIMGNEIALHVLAPAGSEVVCEASSHIVQWEMAAMAVLSGLLPRPVAGDHGLMAATAVEEAINRGVVYRTPTGAISVENTANMAGGSIYDRERLEALLVVAKRYGLPTHLDGARIFNAAEALGTEVATLAAGFDAVVFCLSKGLGAPVGSLLCGSREVITEAWRVRRMLGGGMRQAGVLAAAGLVALAEGPGHLAADHRRAALLAAVLAAHPEVVLDPTWVVTNIVICQVASADAWVTALAARSVLATAVDSRRIRFVTHRDISDADLERAMAAIRTVDGSVS
jgi:threonine aldolase